MYFCYCVYFHLNVVNMLRIQWYTLPDNKSIRIWLTMIYGIWLKKSKTMLDALNIPFNKKVKEISDQEQKMISDELKNHVIESDLKREVQSAIKRIKEIKCYRWIRHSIGLPVRWQLSKKARTAKKLLWRTRVRPVLKK